MSQSGRTCSGKRLVFQDQKTKTEQKNYSRVTGLPNIKKIYKLKIHNKNKGNISVLTYDMYVILIVSTTKRIS